MRSGRQPTHRVKQGERQLGAVERVRGGGSRRRGHRGGGKRCSQLDLSGRVNSKRRQRLVQTQGVVSLRVHGDRDTETFLPVCFKHVGEAEALAAHLARIRFLSGVSAAVALHVGSAGETFPADLTDVWFLSWSRANTKKQLHHVDGRVSQSRLLHNYPSIHHRPLGS